MSKNDRRTQAARAFITTTTMALAGITYEHFDLVETLLDPANHHILRMDVLEIHRHFVREYPEFARGATEHRVFKSGDPDETFDSDVEVRQLAYSIAFGKRIASIFRKLEADRVRSQTERAVAASDQESSPSSIAGSSPNQSKSHNTKTDAPASQDAVPVESKGDFSTAKEV
jgi:hypothetical protein